MLPSNVIQFTDLLFLKLFYSNRINYGCNNFPYTSLSVYRCFWMLNFCLIKAAFFRSLLLVCSPVLQEIIKYAQQVLWVLGIVKMRPKMSQVLHHLHPLIPSDIPLNKHQMRHKAAFEHTRHQAHLVTEAAL